MRAKEMQNIHGLDFQRRGIAVASLRDRTDGFLALGGRVGQAHSLAYLLARVGVGY